MADHLNADDSLGVDSYLTSADGLLQLTLQGDGNLVLHVTQAVWDTGTSGTSVSQAVMQGDGNFVMSGYDGYVWATATNGNPGASIHIQDDGNAVIYAPSGEAIWASNSFIQRARLPLNPAQHGFHFVNNFVNKILDIPWLGQITTYGRCGGMAYACLDYYNAGLPVPPYRSEDFPDGGVPPDGHPMADYIYVRLIDSFFVSSAVNFVSWSAHADHATWFFKGVHRWTREDEFPRVRQVLDEGRPAVLGLVRATNIGEIGSNHQVVAYGYETSSSGYITLFIYDNNTRDQEVVLKAPPGRGPVEASNASPWRGFFLQDYAPKPPPPLP